MKILVTKDAQIAGDDWKKGTILQCSASAGKAAVDEGVAETGEALDKAEKARAKKSADKSGEAEAKAKAEAEAAEAAKSKSTKK